MTNEELLGITALNSWKLVIGRVDQNLAALSDEQLQKQVSPGKNRLFYIVGHLTAVHDRMFPMLGLGERLYPELDEAYITNPDNAVSDTLSAADLRKHGPTSMESGPKPSKRSHPQSGCKSIPQSPTKISRKTLRATASPSC